MEDEVSMSVPFMQDANSRGFDSLEFAAKPHSWPPSHFATKRLKAPLTAESKTHSSERASLSVKACWTSGRWRWVRRSR